MTTPVELHWLRATALGLGTEAKALRERLIEQERLRFGGKSLPAAHRLEDAGWQRYHVVAKQARDAQRAYEEAVCQADPQSPECQEARCRWEHDGSGGVGQKSVPSIDRRFLPRRPKVEELGRQHYIDKDLSANAEGTGGALVPPAKQKCGGDCDCHECSNRHQKGANMPSEFPELSDSYQRNPVNPAVPQRGRPLNGGGEINVGENDLDGPQTGPGDHADEPFGSQVARRVHEWAVIQIQEGEQMLQHLEHKPTQRLLRKYLKRVLAALEEVEAHHGQHYGDLPAPDRGGVGGDYLRADDADDEEELALGEDEEGDGHEEDEEAGAMKQKSLFDGEDGHSDYRPWKDRPSHRADGRDEDFGVEGGHEPGVIHHVSEAGTFLKEIGEGRKWDDDAREEGNKHRERLRKLVDLIDADEEESDLGQDAKKLPKGDALAEFGRGKESATDDDDDDEDGEVEHPGLKAIKDSHRLLAEVGMKPELEDEHRDRARKLGEALSDYHTKKGDGSDDDDVADAEEANEKSLLSKAVKTLREDDRRRGVTLAEIGSKLGGVLDHLNGVANAGAEQRYLQGMAARSLGPTLLGEIRQKALERRVALARLTGREVSTEELLQNVVGRLGIK